MIQCPECKATTGTFNVEVRTTIQYATDGDAMIAVCDLGNADWEDSAKVTCGACSHVGTVYAFHPTCKERHVDNQA